MKQLSQCKIVYLLKIQKLWALFVLGLDRPWWPIANDNLCWTCKFICGLIYLASLLSVPVQWHFILVQSNGEKSIGGLSQPVNLKCGFPICIPLAVLLAEGSTTIFHEGNWLIKSLSPAYKTYCCSIFNLTAPRHCDFLLQSFYFEVFKRVFTLKYLREYFNSLCLDNFIK